MAVVSVRALVDAVQERAGSDDPLVLLEAAVVVAGETSEAADGLVEHYVGAARAVNVSWTVIGERLGVSKQAARQKFAHRLGAGDLVGEGAESMVMAPRLSACLQAAQAAADTDDSVVGTQHLLLGLLQVGAAATILDRLGVTRDRVREAGVRLFEPAVLVDGEGLERRVVGDGEAEYAIAQARRLAARRGQSQFRTEHLLFCLAVDPGSSARRVLNDLGVDVARVKKELEEWLGPVQRRHRRFGKGKAADRACSFCGCQDAGPLVAGPGVWICGDCVQTSAEILRSDRTGLRTG
ncbi:Clp protease N-terminal domain-containing protein [Lentzea sp. BCCO 10_0061]|uniref:Clp protease N-terminal domain-containing protein n=1 Tax=Lentzea sokolovensis TaxID=3095429 RepID=A0ABU4UPW0_9PSEU|nr:Clp protease N-terminal domain-containing protein [Lentzea sp. BCCO 10_0061]MDX8141524.1 Clp protease N-terminal domain-containing protein [Lentzea sp. BCCO 10_0061]